LVLLCAFVLEEATSYQSKSERVVARYDSTNASLFRIPNLEAAYV
jgi:hypothetical protein